MNTSVSTNKSAGKTARSTTRKSKKQKINIENAAIYIDATFNNTIITATDMQGNVVAWSSAGKCGFKGARKSTSFAAQTTAEDLVKFIEGFGIKKLYISVKGPGLGRDASIRVFSSRFEVAQMKDVTRIPHNGCRPRKKRRV